MTKTIMAKKRRFFKEKIKTDEEIQLEEKIKDELLRGWTANRDNFYNIHIGPTNSGKTYSAIQALKQSNSGIYLSPLRLLAWEIFDTLNKDGYPCSLITGEEKIIVKGANFVASTIEMYNSNKKYNVAVIDECFMIADSQRGKFWTDAILTVNANDIHIISNEESAPLIKQLLTITDKTYKTTRYKRKVPLSVDVNISSIKNLQPKTILVTFSRINVLYYKMVLQQQGKKVSILYGNLPPEVKKDQIQAFINGETEILISTDVIGMGINLPCDRVIFLENTKFDGEFRRPLNQKEIKQIGGRAGRFGLSENGYIGALEYSFLHEIESAVQSNIPEKFGYCGINEFIYKLIPKTTPKEKFEYYTNLKVVPNKLKNLLIHEDLKKYTELTSHTDLNKLTDKVAWAFLTCPVNKYNIQLWKDSVSNVAYQNTLYFLASYNKVDINSIKQLEQAEMDIANIDLFIYMFNNKHISQFIHNGHIDFIEIIKRDKNIIIDNINQYLLTKKIKAKEIS